MMYVFLIIGFVLLVKGADFFVDGCSSVARLFKVPAIIIGLTVVAFGTSAPEASVSITAALSGSSDIAISNIVGSNIFNLLVVIGICAMIKPMKISQSIMKSEFPLSILVTILLLFFAANSLFFGHGPLGVSRIEALILFIIFLGFVTMQIRAALKARSSHDDSNLNVKTLSPVLSAVFILGGLIAIVAGGNLVVSSASDIAASFGLSQTFIGLTIVACGTSLPELVTSVVASRKGENELAMGNVVGSNIFNVLLILGLSCTIQPITFGMESVYDILILIIFSAISYMIIRFSNYKVGRLSGAAMVIMYAAYLVYIVLR